MRDAERFKLRFGKYRTPRFSYGAIVECEVRGPMRIVGISTGRIPWPRGIPVDKPFGGASLAVYKGLARAVRLEANIVVRHWWGVSPASVWKWRRALDVPSNTKGTTKLRRLYGQEEWFQKAQRKAWSKARNPERRAKIAAALRGRKRPKRVVAAMRRHFRGKPLTPETRKKMSEAHKARGTYPPAAGRPWEPWEDKLVRTLSTADTVNATGRTVFAVRNRRHALRTADTKPRWERAQVKAAVRGRRRRQCREAAARLGDG